MELIIKKFNELSLDELYELLKVRSEVFVVEQECVYLDIDGIDRESLHIFYKEDGIVHACSRLYYKEGEENVLKLGRVLTRKHGTGLGRVLLEKSVEIAGTYEDVKEIYIEAQQYAIGFYEKVGFVVTSEPFDEDGIPHVEMRLPLHI